jgi:hypothetical protein
MLSLRRRKKRTGKGSASEWNSGVPGCSFED